MSFISNFQSWSRQQAAPVTIGWTVSLVVTAIISLFTNHAPVSWFALQSSGFQIYTLLSYPWALAAAQGFGVIFFLFLIMWLLAVGGSLERDLGTVRFSLFVLSMIVLPAVLMVLAGMLLKSPVLLLGTLVPIAGLTVAWCVRNPSMEIRLMGVFPLQARWLAWLTVLIVFTSYAIPSPILGLVACIHLAVAFAFATNRIPGVPYSRPVYQKYQSKAAREREQAYIDEVKAREKEREERERLRKLFEGSLNDDK